MTATSLTCNVSYTLDGGVDDVVESCVYLSTIIIYNFQTYALTLHLSIASLETAGPRFINIKISDETLKQKAACIQSGERFGVFPESSCVRTTHVSDFRF